MSVDLTTTYLGLKLQNPLVASAGPLTGSLDSLRQLADAGIGAVVLPSLFEEQIEHDELQIHGVFEYQADSFAESLSMFPETADFGKGSQEYLELITAAKEALAVPVIASLNGQSKGGWTRYARMMEEAGADALELNVYFVPTDFAMTGTDVEERYVELVSQVRQAVKIPLAVKIGSQFSSIPYLAFRLQTAGADGLVLFNRFLEPDIDLESLTFTPDLVLSQRHEVRLPLRWIAILRDQLHSSLAASTGIHDATNVIRALLAGADVTMMTAGLLRRGPAVVSQILDDLVAWLAEHEYESVNQMRGSMSRGNCSNPGALERANYMKALAIYTTEYWRPTPQ
jgi:dihydroorotate dehydrogenase (fumarate)